jgi:hypothetical protein
MLEDIFDKIIVELNDIEKIKIYNNAVHKKFITVRMARGNIYMYDCGETYATVFMLSSQNELIEKMKECISDSTQTIIIKYKDGRIQSRFKVQ